jgi:hypothetical protein
MRFAARLSMVLGSCGLVGPAAVAAPGLAAADELRAHADDVADYTLTATLDPVRHTVHGEGTLRWRNTSAVAVREIYLHLYMNAFKNERSAWLRERVGGRGGQRPSSWGSIDVSRFALDGADLWKDAELHRPDDEDETDARVPLPRAVPPGQRVTFAMSWDVQLPNIVERTGFDGSFHMVGQWFPKIARLEATGTGENGARWAHFAFHHLAEFYADFGTYDVTLDVPQGFRVGATGPVVESHVAAGRLRERHVQADVHDFAWTAWDRFLEKRETVGAVAVRVLYPRGYEDDAERELAAVRFALPYFAGRYGAYPYDVLTLVHPPLRDDEAGGMEYPTLITTGGSWFQPRGTHLVEWVTLHELGHEWFYGLLASDEVSAPFLDEGVNAFAEEDVLRALYGSGSMIDLPDLRVDDAALDGVLGNLAEHDEEVGQPAFAFATGTDYARLVYQRTAAILETLRRVYGEAPFWRAMRDYTASERFDHPTILDLRRAFATALGEEAAHLLDVALEEKGWVDYRVESVASELSRPPRGIFDRDGRRETVTGGNEPRIFTSAADSYEGSVLVVRNGTLAFPVVVEMTSASGEKHRVTWDGQGSSIRLPYRSASPLVAAEVDPDHAVLLDDDRANNATSRAAPLVGAANALERVTYWIELLLQLIAP